MKKRIVAGAAGVMVAFGAAAFTVDKIDPPHWWAGMANDTLQLMVYGHDVGKTRVGLEPYAGVAIDKAVAMESPNYALVYLAVGKDARPGTLQLTFTQEGKTTVTRPYELRQRMKTDVDYQGFDQSDVLYLIMPDRFARAGSVTDDEAQATLRHKSRVNRDNPNARHGGNIAGMLEHLDYIDSLGVTAVWVNPVLENDMPHGSYHGYATTDYYRIDPRFGTNEEWGAFVAAAHQKGIKVVMDMIFNHCGSSHPWMDDMPMNDWINDPGNGEFVQTNYRLSTLHDPYVSDYDKIRTTDGWFVQAMPDLNQRNTHVIKYLTQNSIWWIEQSGINGIRMDTHPYADERAMAWWIDQVLEQYPAFNIVGECWYGSEGGEAYWQRGSRTNPNGDPRLPVTMDFILSIKGRDAFNDATNPWNSGLNIIYDHLALDYLFASPHDQLTFLDNHDTDRFLLEEPENLNSWKQAIAFLLTSRGIPQIYYGTELLMNGSKEGSDGFVRRDFPGGFPGDETSAFDASGRTPMQQEAWQFMQKLLQWRRGNDVIAKGSLKHFMPSDGVYIYERKLGDKQVVVVMNGNDEPVTTSWARTQEIMPYGSTIRDMLTDKTWTITDAPVTFQPRQLLILAN